MSIESMNINDWQQIPEYSAFQKSKIALFRHGGDQEIQIKLNWDEQSIFLF